VALSLATRFGFSQLPNAGSGARTTITFKPTQTKFVRVTQTGSAPDAPAWSVLNFRVYAAGSAAK